MKTTGLQILCKDFINSIFFETLKFQRKCVKLHAVIKYVLLDPSILITYLTFVVADDEVNDDEVNKTLFKLWIRHFIGNK